MTATLIGRSLSAQVEYLPYHICDHRTVLHKVHHDEKYPSHLLLPLIPLSD